MKISKTGFNEFKTKIRNETINEINKINEKAVNSDNEYDKIKINNIINPQVITTKKKELIQVFYYLLNFMDVLERIMILLLKCGHFFIFL